MRDDARRVAAEFFGSVREVRPFQGGHINDTFLVETHDDAYVLQRLNAAVFADSHAVMHNIVTVHRHVSGRLLPELCTTRHGKWLFRDNSGTWRAWRRVADAGPVDTLSPAAAESAGVLLGRFHTSVADLDPSTIVETLPHFHDPRRRLDALRAATAADPCGRVDGVIDEIESVLAAAVLAERAADLQARVRQRVAHNDAKLDNVLFRDGTAVCLVDLDTLMPGPWFWDTGDLVRTVATTQAEDDADATVDPILYASVLDGYRRGAATVLEPDEVDALAVAGAIVTFEQAVRFLTDWIEGDVYYRTSRPTQNLDRAHAQLRLLASMPDTVPYP